MDRTWQHSVILVGFGGSGASSAALIWAAGEAGRRHAALRVIQVWQPHPARALYAGAGHGGSEPPRPASTERLAADVRYVLSTALGGDADALDVDIELAEGIAERVLAVASAYADLLVLGSGGQSPVSQPDPLISDRPVGPVVRACLSHSRCPVVIVGPATAEGQNPAPAGLQWKYSLATSR